MGRCIVSPYREAIFGFIIDSRYRHKGYGKKLLQHIIDTYKGTLKLDTSNTLFFYLAENLGFKYIGTIIDEITNLPTLKIGERKSYVLKLLNEVLSYTNYNKGDCVNLYFINKGGLSILNKYLEVPIQEVSWNLLGKAKNG